MISYCTKSSCNLCTFEVGLVLNSLPPFHESYAPVTYERDSKLNILLNQIIPYGEICEQRFSNRQTWSPPMACLWQLACQADYWHIACKMNKLLNAWQKRERVFHIVLSTMIKQEIWTWVTEKLSLTLQNALKQTKDLKRYCRFWSHRKEPCVFGDEMFLPKTRSLFLTKPTFAHIVF